MLSVGAPTQLTSSELAHSLVVALSLSQNEVELQAFYSPSFRLNDPCAPNFLQIISLSNLALIE